MRFKKQIQLHINRNGEIVLNTDMGQTFNTTRVKDANPFGTWLYAHPTEIRHWQKDMIQLIHQAYNPEANLHPIQLYWVYQKGRGYTDQSQDIALAQIISKNIWVLMTPENTWIIESNYDNFYFTASEASGSVINKETRDEIWDFRDLLIHGKIIRKKSYSDNDYLMKGLL